MSVIFVLLPLALAVAAIAAGVFVWAARSGQFDDLETPAARILEDDDPDGISAPGADGDPRPGAGRPGTTDPSRGPS